MDKTSQQDPTQSIREQARLYPGTVEGSSCSQAAFRIGKTAFLFVGEQGGRFKAMFKLKHSMPEATHLARETPDDFQVGPGGWVTARFTVEEPLAETLWRKWLEESFELSRPRTRRRPSS